MKNIKYKLEPNDNIIYEFDLETFERQTLKHYPYWQITDEGQSKIFAVCPECNNPIELRNMYRFRGKSPKIWHCQKSIYGITKFNKKAYDLCTNREKSIYKIYHCYSRDIEKHCTYVLSKMTGEEIEDILAGLQLFIEFHTKHGEDYPIDEDMSSYFLCNFFDCEIYDKNEVDFLEKFSDEQLIDLYYV